MTSSMDSGRGGGFGDFLAVLRRRFWLVLICVLVVPAAAYWWTERKDERFTASAEVLLLSPGFEQAVASPVDSPVPGNSGDTLPTDVGVASLETIAERTGAELERRGKPANVEGKVVVTTDGDAAVLQIEATDFDPEQAALIANTYARQFIAFRRSEDRRRIRAARRALRERTEIESRRRRSEIRRLSRDRERALSRLSRLGPDSRDGPRAQALDDRVGELRQRIAQLRADDAEGRQRVASLVTLERLQTGNARIVDRATPPTEPSAPQPVRNVVAGTALGLILGILLVVLLELVDRRLRDPEEVSELFDAPILGAIPHSPSLRGGAGNSMRPPPLDREAFRMVDAYLRHNGGHREDGERSAMKSVLVTSAAPGDGKTTVAWNIAVAAAESGLHVLFIEADLRHPQIAQRLHAPAGSRGLSDVLRGKTGPAEAVHQIPITDTVLPAPANGAAQPPNGNGAGERRTPPMMDVLLAGPAIADPRGLLSSEAMTRLLRSAASEFDLTVIDTPPVAVVSDAIPLMQAVDGVLVVTRLGYDTREAAKLLSGQLRGLGAPLVGVVVNAVEPQDGAYGAAQAYARTYARSAGRS